MIAYLNLCILLCMAWLVLSMQTASAQAIDPKTIGITRQLHPEDSGADVEAVQRLLVTYGYMVPTHGTMDAATTAELRRYQADNGLRVDGWIGVQTSRALGIVWAPTPAAPNSSSAEPSAAGVGTAPNTQGVVPGKCSSYAPLAARYGLPWGIFSRIAWRESGCNHRVLVFDHDDSGGGLLGLNLKGALAGYWRNLCGLTLGNVINAAKNIECAAKQYRAHGLSAWR